MTENWQSTDKYLIWVDKKDRCDYAQVALIVKDLRNEIEFLKKRKEALQEENKKLKGYNEMLEKRLRHLLQSEFIRSFDIKDFKTKKYKRDIKEADEIKTFHYEHLNTTPILTGDDARAFTKAFIEYLERRY